MEDDNDTFDIRDFDTEEDEDVWFDGEEIYQTDVQGCWLGEDDML